MTRERLGLPAERCIVIEDSMVGLRAARGASMQCIVTPTASTGSADFMGEVCVKARVGGLGKVGVGGSRWCVSVGGIGVWVQARRGRMGDVRRRDLQLDAV
eukprot:366327-Chlamydomonas_euryale.AAC.9